MNEWMNEWEGPRTDVDLAVESEAAARIRIEQSSRFTDSFSVDGAYLKASYEIRVICNKLRKCRRNITTAVRLLCYNTQN
jgi:hypothetical protein